MKYRICSFDITGKVVVADIVRCFLEGCGGVESCASYTHDLQLTVYSNRNVHRVTKVDIYNCLRLPTLRCLKLSLYNCPTNQLD